MSLHSWKVTYLLLQWWNSTPGSISHIGSQGCLTAIPNMPNNHNHTGKEGPDAMLPSCYWQLSMIETSEQKLHQRQQVAILSLNASLGSLCATSSWQPPTLSQRTKPRNFAGSSLDTAPFLARLLRVCGLQPQLDSSSRIHRKRRHASFIVGRKPFIAIFEESRPFHAIHS